MEARALHDSRIFRSLVTLTTFSYGSLLGNREADETVIKRGQNRTSAVRQVRLTGLSPPAIRRLFLCHLEVTGFHASFAPITKHRVSLRCWRWRRSIPC